MKKIQVQLKYIRMLTEYIDQRVNGRTEINANLKSIPSGVYLYQINIDGNKKQLKVIVE